MIYIYEPFYFRENRLNFPHALRVTAQAVGRWCDWYEATLISPQRGKRAETKNGMLPENFEEKKKFIDAVLEWLINNSLADTSIRFFMDASPIKKDHLFAYYDSGQWNLNLNVEEFEKIQQIWEENNLPQDLFYAANRALRILKPLGWFGKFMNGWGWTWESYEIYSPRQWEEELKKHPESINKLSRNVPL